MSILDAEGRPVDPVARAMAEMERRVAECLFGVSPNRRVYGLRRSVLGDEAGRGPDALGGLAAAVPVEVP